MKPTLEMKMKCRFTDILCGALLAASSVNVAAAYPERPIRLIVPFAPGGNVDLTARAITPGMGDLLGRNIIIDNRAGAGGAVGSEIAAKSVPDGYTLLFSSTGSLTIAPVVSTKLRYDPIRDFETISLASNVPVIMLVPLSSPAKNVKEFVAHAKSRGELIMGSSGNFATGRLAGELFQGVTGTKFTHVPYKGGNPAMLDLIGGRIDVMFDQISSAIGHIKGGKVRALAVNATNREGSRCGRCRGGHLYRDAGSGKNTQGHHQSPQRRHEQGHAYAAGAAELRQVQRRDDRHHSGSQPGLYQG